MNPPRLTGKSNPLIKTVRLAASQSRRAPRDLVVAEGVRLLEEATRSGYRIEAVLASRSFGESEREKALLAGWSGSEVPVRRVADALLEGLSGVLTPQGALALVRVPRRGLASLPESGRPLILCLCGIQDPGNLGTLIRTAAAAGATAVCSTAGTVSARNPKALRATAGAFFHIPVVEGISPREFLAFCASRRIQPFRADRSGDRLCWETDLRSASAILLGNEGRGFDDPEWAPVPLVRIPIAPEAESLNVAAAGAVLLLEACRQRRDLPQRSRGTGC